MPLSRTDSLILLECTGKATSMWFHTDPVSSLLDCSEQWLHSCLCSFPFPFLFPFPFPFPFPTIILWWSHLENLWLVRSQVRERLCPPCWKCKRQPLERVPTSPNVIGKAMWVSYFCRLLTVCTPWVWVSPKVIGKVVWMTCFCRLLTVFTSVPVSSEVIGKVVLGEFLL